MHTVDEIYDMDETVGQHACDMFNTHFKTVVKYVKKATLETNYRFYTKKESVFFDITADDLNTPDEFRKTCIAIFNDPLFPMYYAEMWDTFIGTFIAYDEYDDEPKNVREEDLKTVWVQKQGCL